MICTPAGPRERAQSDPLEFGHNPIESLAGEPTAAQCGTEVGPIQEARTRCRQRWRDARSYEQPLYVLLPPSAIYVAHGSRCLGIVVGLGAHADFQCGAVPERMAQEPSRCSSPD